MFRKKKYHNIFIRFLELLDVRHTVAYSRKLYNEHPHKNSFFGLCDLLEQYNVENKGVQLPDKEEYLPLLECPFIARMNDGRSVIVTETTDQEVGFELGEEKHTATFSVFIPEWTGSVILVEPDENSGEPDYHHHRKEQMLQMTPLVLLLLAGSALLVFIWIENQVYANWKSIFSVLLNLTGIVKGVTLLQKQAGTAGSFTSKVCTLLKNSECDSALGSPVAKLWGTLSWSEMGTGYFAGNLLLLTFCPSLVTWMALLNLLILPYPLWSIWYQKVKLQQWCPLCLVVQLIIVVLFLLNILSGYYATPKISIQAVLYSGTIYVVPILLIHFFMRSYEKAQKVELIIQQINSIKANPDIFQLLLSKQPRYPIESLDPVVLFGNNKAPIQITIVTNAHCIPCAKQHPDVEMLLANAGDKVGIQYVFISFNEILDSSTEFLIWSYTNHSREKAMQLYEEWFRKGTDNRESMFQKYNFSGNNLEEKRVVMAHKKWVKESGLKGTPSVLVNGHLLMEEYELKDLRLLV